MYTVHMNTRNYLVQKGYTRDCPRTLIRVVRAITQNSVVDDQLILKVLDRIRQEFDPRQYIISTTQIFGKSRFIGIREILKIRLRTCGAMATVVASVFRSLGIPTKLVNGRYTRQNANMRHAWNEIFRDDVKKFVPYDITRKDFRLDRYHKKKDEWCDWSEMEKTYNKSGPKRAQ